MQPWRQHWLTLNRSLGLHVDDIDMVRPSLSDFNISLNVLLIPKTVQNPAFLDIRSRIQHPILVDIETRGYSISVRNSQLLLATS